MKKIVLLALVSAFFACSPTDVPEGTASKHDAAPAATGTATSTNTASNPATNTKTDTATATNTATNATVNDAGIPATVTVTETKTVTQIVTVSDTSTNTGIDGGVVTIDSGAAGSDAAPVLAPDTAAATPDASADTVAPTPSCAAAEICGNGIDDDCNGLIDDIAQCGTSFKPDAAPDTGSACSGTATAPCTATIGGVLYTGTKQCVNGTFSSCLNLVLASTDAGSDKVQPVVLTPFCGLSDVNNLPAGVAIPFYANASDNVGVVSCSFFVNNTLAPGTSVLEASGSWRLDIVLGAGTSAINVRCLDAAGNGGVPAAVLTVKAIGTDGGVSPDTLPATDTTPAIDTLAPADTQVNADTVVTPDSQAPADTVPSATTCFVLVNNQYMSIPIGQQIVCASGTLSGTQQCVADGTSTKMTPCMASGNTVSDLKAVLDCSLTKVTLSGNVAGNLFPSPTDTSPIVEICLNGDGINGMTASNRSHCLPYDPDSNHVYEFGKQLGGPSDVINLQKGVVYRITYVGVTQQTAVTGQVRWSFNNPDLSMGTGGTNGLPVMANDAANLCWVSSETIAGDTAKLIVDGRKAP